MLTLAAIGCAVSIACGVALFSSYAGCDGLKILLHGGGAIWVTVTPEDARLPHSMRLALQAGPPQISLGQLIWTSRATGFETSDLSVRVQAEEVDRILLARIDPKYFRFEVLNRADGDRDLRRWLKASGASLIVNGSYFGRDGRPSTPVVSNGVRLGPERYEATHGVFVASDELTGLFDLRGRDWRQLLDGRRNGVVSYPMLIGPGREEILADRHWLSNRSFIGQDSAGRIVIGTTQQAFFSLDRFGAFLRAAPLGLVLALNLDGGSVACQGVSLAGYERSFCGDWESRTENGAIKLLLPPLFGRHPLPNVIAVWPR